MSDDIDEFIRRAAERRKQQGQGQRRQAQRPAQPPVPQQKQQPRPIARLAQPEVVEAEVIDDVTTIDEHLARREFEQRTAQFGAEPGLADDRVEARLHQTFDHQLGRLAQQIVGDPAATVRSATDAAAKVTEQDANKMLVFLVQALRTPQMVRQAVILSEILARPEHRW